MSLKMPYGAYYEPDKTVFRLWTSQAVKVVLQRFSAGSQDEPNSYMLNEAPMVDIGNSVFELTVYGDLKNQYYQYVITDCVGKTVVTADPWALACGVNGSRSMVVDLKATDPYKWNEDVYRQALSKAPVIWETHVRDFSIDEHSGVSEHNRGKYLAFTEQNTTLDNKNELPTCMNYVKKLGVTHIQLQPIFDYYTVDESRPDSMYNWGYDPENYNIPEGSYSSDPFHGEIRIQECKQMIQAIHSAGLGVIMDVVYNHTYDIDSWLERSAPGIYYRYDKNGKLGDASGCGNETASERPKFREYMINSVLYWAEEYHIDGFRFDLMAVHDLQTMKLLRKELDKLPNGKNIILYGEPWSAKPANMDKSSVPASKANFDQFVKHLGMFSDDTRNAICGSVFEIINNGYATDDISTKNRNVLLNALRGWCFGEDIQAKSPLQILQYVSCHDNFALWDRLVMYYKKTDFDISYYDIVQRNKLASGIYLTLPGCAFLQSGEEFARTKYGDENSFASSDAINKLDWKRTKRFANLIEWYKNLIELRQHFMPPQYLTRHYMRKIEVLESADNCIAFVLKGKNLYNKFLIIYNPYQVSKWQDLPNGIWSLLCDGKSSSLWKKSLIKKHKKKIEVKPLSVTILGI